MLQNFQLKRVAEIDVITYYSAKLIFKASSNSQYASIFISRKSKARILPVFWPSSIISATKD